MRLKIWLISFLGGISFLYPLHSAPRYSAPARYIDSETSVSMREAQDGISLLRHQISNQETEIRAFAHQLDSLQTILESLTDQLQETTKSQKEQLKGNANSLEIKIASLESTLKSVSSDIKLLQNHANDTSAVLQELKQKLAEENKKSSLQNRKIESLQAALSSLMEAVQVKMEIPTVAEASKGSYKVKSGDSLEKIARAHGTTVKAMLELNGMSSDRIVVGKTLKIPN